MTNPASSPEGSGARGVTGFYRVLACALAAFFAAIALVSLAVWVKNGHITSLISVVALLWLVHAGVFAFAAYKTANRRFTAAFVFLAALTPRVAVLLVQTYTPTSDFANYWAMGQAFLAGDKATIAALVDHYRVLEFSGLSVLWGCMQWLSGGTLLGFQCLQCVLTAGIAVMVYLLGKRADKRLGLLAGLLYAVYPSNLVMSQVFTNQHLATLLALGALLLFLRGMEARGLGRRILLGALAGLVLLVSHYSYPASIITRIACVLYAAGLCFTLRRQVLPILCVLAAFLIAFSAGKALTDQLLVSGGYRLETTERFHQTERILTGLTVETDGQLDQALRDTYRAMSDGEALAAIGDAFRHPGALLKLFARKALKMWGAMDSSFTWYSSGENETGQALAVSTALGALDVVFVAAVYLLAAAGLFLRRKALRPFALYLWIVAGWIGVYLLYEMQMRYRYYAMPFLMLFAALGIQTLLDHRKKATA